MDDVVYSEFIEGTDIKISISLFKGKYRVDIRKYWDDKGEMKPSPKGINMTVDEFEKMLDIVPNIKEKIEGVKGK